MTTIRPSRRPKPSSQKTPLQHPGQSSQPPLGAHSAVTPALPAVAAPPSGTWPAQLRPLIEQAPPPLADSTASQPPPHAYLSLKMNRNHVLCDIYAGDEHYTFGSDVSNPIQVPAPNLRPYRSHILRGQPCNLLCLPATEGQAGTFKVVNMVLYVKSVNSIRVRRSFGFGNVSASHAFSVGQWRLDPQSISEGPVVLGYLACTQPG